MYYNLSRALLGTHKKIQVYHERLNESWRLFVSLAGKAKNISSCADYIGFISFTQRTV